MNEPSLIQYIRDPSSIEAKDLPRLLGEVERLRAKLWSALCAAAATTGATTSMPSTGFGFLTVAEVAAKLKFSRGHVYELVRRGSLRVIRTGRTVRVPIDALHDLNTIAVGRVIYPPNAGTVLSRRRQHRGQTPPTDVETEVRASKALPSSPDRRRRKGAETQRSS